MNRNRHNQARNRKPKPAAQVAGATPASVPRTPVCEPKGKEAMHQEPTEASNRVHEVTGMVGTGLYIGALVTITLTVGLFVAAYHGLLFLVPLFTAPFVIAGILAVVVEPSVQGQGGYWVGVATIIAAALNMTNLFILHPKQPLEKLFAVKEDGQTAMVGSALFVALGLGLMVGATIKARQANAQ